MDWDLLVEKEKKSGYYNSSVFGGFNEALKKAAQEEGQNKLASLAEAYGRASLVEREEILNQIAPLIKALPKGETNSRPRGEQGKPLFIPIQYLKGVGPKRAALLKRLGVNDIEGLLNYFPRDYQDRREITPISALEYGLAQTICGEVLSLSIIRPRPKMTILKALIQDESGYIAAVWFNQPYLEKKLVKGVKILLYGRTESKYNQREFMVQDYAFEGDISPRRGIVPIYPTTGSLNQKALANIIALSWEKYGKFIENILPEKIIKSRDLLPRRRAVEWMHFPPDLNSKEKARQTLAYEELFILQLAMVKSEGSTQQPGIAHKPLGESFSRFEKALPFSLMKAQKRVITEIYRDMESPYAMARLLQGDVGAGKTVVAASALFKAVSGGYQGVMMAPTEILAQQHYNNLKELFQALGYKIELFTGSLKGKARQKLLESLKEGKIDILIGTHTLIQEGVEIPRLGLAITDEQHRFGVRQRASLVSKGIAPDLLVMTATPIPRTLALTLYGDLQISVIDELPPGRKPVKTYGVENKLEKRVWAFIEKEISQGRQAFIVCPLVEESEKLDLESAVSLAQNLAEKIFPKRRVALIHGRLKSKEKAEIMNLFRLGEIDILVATTVIEVGIDIPNATIMLVRDAHRFGLAQLHQLRGRIGRGNEQAYCILMHEAKSEIAKERIRVMAQTNDGFQIAEADLRLRGPGEFFGTRQHGIPELKTANIFKDSLLLEKAREDALSFIAGFPNWEDPGLKTLKEHLEEKYQFLN